MSLRIGIICPSEIAFRRFLPSLKKVSEFKFAGVAIASPEEWFGNLDKVSIGAINEQQMRERLKAQSIVDLFGGKIYDSYLDIVTAKEVDAIYLPLPPALHHKWAKKALVSGKHSLIEKPFTTSLEDTEELLSIARKNNLAVHEDYMFIFHNQLQAINSIIQSGELGKVRHYRIQFGFPRRAANDFRYNKALGGGALLDAGGYTIRYASLLLGETAVITAAASCYDNDCDVDIFGSASMMNAEGTIAQLAFGMDNNYKCLVEAWGAEGTLTAERVLTAPDGFVPNVIIRKGNEDFIRELPSDESFVKSIQHFAKCINDTKYRIDNYKVIEKQAEYMETFKITAKW